MFAIEMLPAAHGDALVVEYGNKGEPPHRLLIDCGTYHTWTDVRKRLLARKDSHYELFVVTHVDEDHIGGSIALLDDPDLRHKIRDIWFNGYVHIDAGSSVLGPLNGEQLTSRIAKGPYRWNDCFPKRRTKGVGGPAVVPSAGPLPAFDLPGGAVAVLLSPSGPKLQLMKDKWEEKIKEAHLGMGDDGHTKSPGLHMKSVAEAPPVVARSDLEVMAKRKQSDTSEANGSSIAFVLEFGKKRLLLGADAHADVLAANLVRYGERVGETRPRIDLFKLSHHGSGANLTSACLDAMSCRRFLVSASGHNHGHPDDSALARAILGASGPSTFYCNYASPRTQPWVARGAGVGATFTLPKPGREGLRVAV